MITDFIRSKTRARANAGMEGDLGARGGAPLRRILSVAHRVYAAIVGAVRTGKLAEPFSRESFGMVCPGLGPGTYAAFLDKHSEGNPGRNSELFRRVSPGQFECLRPFRYGL